MNRFDRVIGRADVPALESLIGSSAVKLLKALDPALIRVSSLREVFLGLNSPSEMLLDSETREEIVDLLKISEANDLAAVLGCPECEDPWSAIKGLQIRRNSKKHTAACDFFGVDIPEIEETNEPIHERQQADYPLFDYQRSAADRCVERLKSQGRRAVLHMPTGSGKTRTAMHVIARFLVENEPTVVVWLAYSEELCEQAAHEFLRAWKTLGNREIDLHRFWARYDGEINDCHDGLVVAGLGKLYSRALNDIGFIARFAESVRLVVIDEAHQAIAETYALTIDALQAKSHETAVLGLTATPGRTWDDIDEDRKLAEFFCNEKVALQIPGYSNPVEFLIERGYLARPAFRSLSSHSGCSLTERDMKLLEADLDVPMKVLRSIGEDAQRNLLVVSEAEKLADKHHRVLVFAASVESAMLVARTLTAHGRHACRVVTGQTPGSERQSMIRWYKEPSEESRILCNYGVLTTGFDAPRTSAVIIARPTKSLVLFSQMVGRATRGPLAGGNASAEVVTVIDTALPGFRDLSEFFVNWEDAGWENDAT